MAAEKEAPKAITFIFGPYETPRSQLKNGDQVKRSIEKQYHKTRRDYHPHCEVVYDRATDCRRLVATQDIPKDSFVLVEDSILFIQQIGDQPLMSLGLSTALYMVQKKLDLQMADSLSMLLPRDISKEQDTRVSAPLEAMKLANTQAYLSTRTARLSAKITRNVFSEGGCLMLFITASFVNHSCRPSAIIDFKYDPNNRGVGVTIKLKATRDILKGQEITLDYHMMSKIDSREERQQLIKQHLLFDCLCERCEEEKQ